MRNKNPPRILGDVSHALSICILMFSIHWNRSAEGVSLITQAFYAIVFCTRYLDLFAVTPWYAIKVNAWNFFFKIFYIVSSFYILLLMTRVFARTREREVAWKMGAYSLGASIVLAPVMTLIFRGEGERGPLSMFEAFSLILESVCVLPQLLLLRQTSVPTVIDSFYLLALGSYRAFYILNWIWRELDNDEYVKPDTISVIFGVIQTLLYVDFAWVYWTRQRVKLRSGGIVDADDLSRGWLLNRLLGRVPVETDEDAEASAALNSDDDGTPRPARPPAGRSGGRWGARGISVSADDGVLNGERFDVDAAAHPDAKMRDPEELARALNDDDDEDEAEDEARARDHKGSKGIVPSSVAAKAGVSSGEEWRK